MAGAGVVTGHSMNLTYASDMHHLSHINSKEDHEEAIDDIIYRIQVYVYPRRIRVKEFFGDFDPLHCGRCTRKQFARVINTIGLRFEEEEVHLITDHFHDTSPHVQPPQDINYYKFVQAIDEIYVTGNLERNPLGEVASPGATLQTTFVVNDLGDYKEDRVLHVLHRLSALCKARGLVFRECYSDIDGPAIPSPANINPRKGGKCNPNQFLRYFPFKKEIDKDDVTLLIEKYRTKSGDVAYGRIHTDISEVMTAEPPPFPTSPLYLRPDTAEWSHSKLHIVEKIKSKVVEKRLRLKDAFMDFDVLRKGFCTIGQLKTVFTILNLDREITKEDFERLLAVGSYVRDDGMFNYALLMKDVDSAFTTAGLEKTPLQTISMPDATTTAPGRRNKQTLSLTTQHKIRELEEKIRSRIKLRRMLVKPAFRDMDKTNCGKILKNQFSRVMQILGFDLDETAIALLASAYCDRGNHHDFNYLDFCKVVDPPDDDMAIAQQQLNGPYQEFVPAKYFHPITGSIIPLEQSQMSV